MSRHPIAEYALPSDCHSAALVHRSGSTDWLCFPRYDAPSVCKEGSFLLCTFWLAHALALGGEVGQAREVFGRAAALANDLGLLAEEADGTTGELLGNFPQAFSHIGLVNAAWAIFPHTARWS
jgi:GH15 family glucan-1,4-alpha-glucosidase